MSAANPMRGEASLEVDGRALVVRPSFQALVAAESELGPLFELVERAAEGRLSLAEVVALIWHCVTDEIDREELGEALVAAGLKAVAPVLRTLIQQILAGR